MFCKANVSLSELWIHHGINPCLFELVTVCFYANLILVFGFIQWVRYARGSAVPNESRPASKLFYFQIFVSILMPIICVLRFSLQATYLDDHTVYGYMIVHFGFSVICWPISIILILLERTRRLSPSDIKSGHSFVLLMFWCLAFLTENLAFVSYHSDQWWFRLQSQSDYIEFTLFILRYFATGFLFFVGFCAPGIPKEYVTLRLGESADVRPRMGGSTWSNFFKKAKILLPMMWPRNNFLLQLVVLFCFLLLILGRLANVFVPIYYKLIVNALGGDGGEPRFCWELILQYVVIKFFQGGGTGGMGLLNNLRSFLWISVQQYTTREVQVKLFQHLHSLSLRWHLGRKTGEVIRIMDRGTSSVTQLLSYIMFNIMPTVFDIIIAVVYFSTAFNIWFGLIVFVTMTAYLICTIAVTEWRTKFRRSMNLADNELRTKSVDSLLNYETVKYYCGEEFEKKRYTDCVLDYQREEWKSIASLSLLNTSQSLIINAGLLVGSLVCAWMVFESKLTVGDYVLFSSYLIQLYTPLNWFGTYYRVIQQSFIDAENMFDLLDEKQEVFDKEFPEVLALPQGKIEFSDVGFHYSEDKPILRHISFTVQPGKTIAIVGPSGAGKSTVMRLLFRFFDVTQGRILIDDRDIREYSQSSLRRAIGVVPQDTVLFNESIMYNIRYGKVLATDDEVKMAARNADVHRSIESFPNQYETMVGERGLKLSGGEKQRIAIARTILKSPTFILLDEATSALDTQTERNIQSALMKICSGRTTVIVAHRLSTVIHADTIVVLKDGVIAERGSHVELLSTKGLYYSMWMQQQENSNHSSNSSSDPE